MKSKKFWYILLCLVLIVGAGFGGYFLRGCEFGRNNVAGKAFAWNQEINLAWKDGLIDEQKMEILDGQTEEELKNTYKNLYSNYRLDFGENGEVSVKIVFRGSAQNSDGYYTLEKNSTVKVWSDETHTGHFTIYRFINGKLCYEVLENLDTNPFLGNLKIYFVFEQK